MPFRDFSCVRLGERMKLSRLFCAAALASLSACAGGSNAIPTSSSAHTLSSSLTTVNWTVQNYNSSGHALSPLPAAYAGGTASFNFASGSFTALLISDAKTLTGNLTGKTLNDTISVTGMNAAASFVDQNNGGCTPDRQSVRFYFETPGFAYANFWWSNPVSVTLANNGAGGVASTTISASLSDPSQWSDYNGKSGTTDVAGFTAAVAKVSQVGLSFGGGCFFENGVTTSDGSGTFSSTFTEQ